MDQLLDKIREFTADGAPGVGQIIELGDLAKKVGVKKLELEKLISEALKNSVKVNEVSIEPIEKGLNEIPVAQEPAIDEYVRPDMDAARLQFEEEMKLRQATEQSKLTEPTIEFNNPEITFPELNVSFGNTEEPEKVEEIPTVKDLPDMNSLAPPVSSFQESEIKIEIKEEKFEPIEIKSTEFIPEPQKSEVTFEESPKVEPINPKPFETENYDYKKEDVLRKIIEDNLKEKRAAELNSYTENVEKRTGKSYDLADAPPNASAATKASGAKVVTLQESKASRTAGIIAIIASFIFGFVGLFAGIYAYNLGKTQKQTMKENPNLYGSEITQNVNLAYVLGLGGIIIGGFRVLAFIRGYF